LYEARLSRPGVWLALWGVFLLASLVGRQALAWDFDEHRDVCQMAYAHACEETKGRAESTSEKARWDLACRRERRFDAVYGQACALAGDRVVRPEDLASALGGVWASSDVYYYFIALINQEHFQPQSLRYWLKYHVQAIGLAKDASGDVDGAQVSAFEKAMFMSAFSDHFLADSFSAGHMGFNRMASSAGAAKAYHDAWNDSGRWVRSADGCEWFAKGDGHIKDVSARENKAHGCNIEGALKQQAASVPDATGKKYDLASEERANLEHVLKAENIAVQEVLETFVFGAAKPFGDAKVNCATAVWNVVPVAFSVRHREKHWYAFATDQPDDPDKPNHPVSVPASTYEPLMKVRMPAKYAYALSLSPEWQRPFSGTSELDAMAQLAMGPYQADMPVIHGFYLDLRLGYGREWYAEETSGTVHRHGPAAGVDFDFPILRTAEGFVLGDVVLGVQSLWWKRVGVLAGLRANLYLGRALVQITAGFIDRFFDYEAEHMAGWNRFALMTSISGGWIQGGYPTGGIPQARPVEE
jgi:hypothetical protein